MLVLTLLSLAASLSRPPALHVEPAVASSEFACEGERKLLARFEGRRSGAVAVVDAGDGPHVLPLTPWAGGPPQVRWSDGRRTLEWNPGVQLMWMDGDTHLMCGRGGHHH